MTLCQRKGSMYIFNRRKWSNLLLLLNTVLSNNLYPLNIHPSYTFTQAIFVLFPLIAFLKRLLQQEQSLSVSSLRVTWIISTYSYKVVTTWRGHCDQNGAACMNALVDLSMLPSVGHDKVYELAKLHFKKRQSCMTVSCSYAWTCMSSSLCWNVPRDEIKLCKLNYALFFFWPRNIERNSYYLDLL